MQVSFEIPLQEPDAMNLQPAAWFLSAFALIRWQETSGAKLKRFLTPGSQHGRNKWIRCYFSQGGGVWGPQS